MALKGLAPELLTGVESYEFEKLCKNDKIIEYVVKVLQEFGLNRGLNKTEIPLKIILSPEEWTISNALLTPTMKIKRRNIQTYYQSDIDRLYGKN